MTVHHITDVPTAQHGKTQVLRLKFRYIDMKILVGGPSATAAMGMTLSTKLLSISDNGDALVGGEHGQLIWVRRIL